MQNIGLPKRFARKVFQGPKGKCWIWTGAIADDGYGRFYLHQGPGGVVRPHRYLYEIASGTTLNANEELLHMCDVTICVNPEHLSPGSKSDNMQDRSGKRRFNNGHGIRGMDRQGRALRARHLRDEIIANGWNQDRISNILAGVTADQETLF
ncbi:hypothetical protein H6F58_04730 [Glutamicibacter sp. FBE19]|nr:hypothetical protein [Glutamicibacter sp. FBE19]